MEQILQSINLGTLLGRFQAQGMEPQAVLAASDQDLIRLGVTTIGDRIRIRDACRKKIDENNASSSQTSAREERLSIFNTRRHNSRSQTRVAARSSSGATKKAGRGNPWSPIFICLADSTASKTPSSLEKEILFKAGLGLKKIKLDTHDDEQTVVNKISSHEKDASGNALGFQQLKSCGGFEMMRCLPNCRDLSLINCSWNAKDLRSNLGGGQGKIYLRPIQRSLSTQPIVAESHSEVKEKCYMCNKEILVHKLRDHLWSCTEGLDSGDDEDPNEPIDTLQSPTATGDTTLSTCTTRAAQSAAPLRSQQSHSDSSMPNANIPLTLAPTMTTFSDSPTNLLHPTSPNTDRLLTDDLGSSTSSTSVVPSSAVAVVDLTHTTNAVNDGQSVHAIVEKTTTYCQQNNIVNPVEILRYFQQKMVIGRALEVQSVDEVNEGETNFIMVDRQNLMLTAFDEISFLTELRKTLQVQFYGEVSFIKITEKY